jgi:two-component system response regulator NreC
VPIKVLIADDNLMFRKLIAQYLLKLPEVVVVGDAVDGSEAVQMAKNLQPDIVLLDVSMPHQPANTASRAIKTAAHGTKVYLCSAHSDKILTDMAALAEADGVVRKSSLKSDLLAIIRPESISGTLRPSPPSHKKNE